MTSQPSPIFTDYLRMEAEANAKPEGSDHDKLIAFLAEKYEADPDDVRRVIRENTIMGPC